MLRNDRPRWMCRSGGVVLESLLALPVLVAVFFASVEYGIVLVTRSTITQAAAVGVREAGKGVDILLVRDAVNTILAANSIAITDSDNTAGSGKKIILEDSTGVAGWLGDPNLVYVPPNTLAAGEVRVTVWILFSAKKTDGVTRVINAFNDFGFSLNGKGFRVSSLVKKE